MKVRLMVFFSFTGVGLYLSRPTLLSNQTPNESRERLVLRLEKGAQPSFIVRTEPPAPGERAKAKGEPTPRPDRGAPGEGRHDEAIQYRILVKEVAGDSATLWVGVDQALPPTTGRAKAPSPPPGETPGGHGGITFGSYTVVVDRDGFIQEDTDNTVRSGAGDGKQKEEEPPRSARAIPPRMKEHLELMLGAGLHAGELERGRILDRAPDSTARSGPATSGSGAPGSSGDAAAGAGASPAVSGSFRFRYEGTQERSEGRLARFAILTGAVAPGPPAATGEPAKKGSEETVRKASGKEEVVVEKEDRTAGSDRGAVLREVKVGEATYRMADGALEALDLDPPALVRGPREGAPAGSARPGAEASDHLSIRRVDRETSRLQPAR